MVVDHSYIVHHRGYGHRQRLPGGTVGLPEPLLLDLTVSASSSAPIIRGTMLTKRHDGLWLHHGTFEETCHRVSFRDHIPPRCRISSQEPLGGKIVVYAMFSQHEQNRKHQGSVTAHPRILIGAMVDAQRS